MDDWRDGIFEAVKAAGATQVAYVPDAGHSRLIERSIEDNDLRAVSLTTEEEGVALLAGAWLGGAKGVLLLQSSGVGNCVNMLSLARTCESRRPAASLGVTTRAHLELCGATCYRCDRPEDAPETVESAFRFAYYTNSIAAVLLGQRLIGAKVFEEPEPC